MIWPSLQIIYRIKKRWPYFTTILMVQNLNYLKEFSILIQGIWSHQTPKNWQADRLRYKVKWDRIWGQVSHHVLGQILDLKIA